MGIGNSWVWENENGSRDKITIIDSGIVINGKSYFTTGIGSYLRYNESDSTFYYLNYIDSQEVAYYKKSITYNDTIKFLYEGYPAFFYLELEFPAYVFDSLVTIKWVTYDYYGGLVLNDRLWTEEFGMLHHGDAVTGTIFSTLKGCVIDGKAYGDTTILDVDNLISEIPGEFKLFQNYPNPFNPVTKIKFTIPETVGTKLDLSVLKVYDILGNEVATLVNEYKPAGNYEVEFNAGNLPSGVYIYKLTAGSFVSSKKMMVIK